MEGRLSNHQVVHKLEPSEPEEVTDSEFSQTGEDISHRSLVKFEQWADQQDLKTRLSTRLQDL